MSKSEKVAHQKYDHRILLPCKSNTIAKFSALQAKQLRLQKELSQKVEPMLLGGQDTTASLFRTYKCQSGMTAGMPKSMDYTATSEADYGKQISDIKSQLKQGDSFPTAAGSVQASGRSFPNNQVITH